MAHHRFGAVHAYAEAVYKQAREQRYEQSDEKEHDGERDAEYVRYDVSVAESYRLVKYNERADAVNSRRNEK